MGPRVRLPARLYCAAVRVPSLVCLTWLLISLVACHESKPPQAPVTVHELRIDLTARHQVIDGFGTTSTPDDQEAASDWYADLYYRDLRASILRIDVTPTFKAPASDYLYNSPWFHGRPPPPGPEGNNVRTYHDAADYTREYAERKAGILVMGPNIEQNILTFDFEAPSVLSRGRLATRGLSERDALGDFKLIGSIWSPAPWLKHTSGRHIEDTFPAGPKAGTAWPFIWAGNFSGGELDTSGTPLTVFDDSQVGGSGPTSALTQFARSTAAYLLGFQRRFAVRFHAISIQNELGFETFYNSCAYRDTRAYAAALKAVRAELDRHKELTAIAIMGPEDLMGDAYSLWTLGSGTSAYTKNLRFLNELWADPEAKRTLAMAAIHGYAEDGVSASGSDPTQWHKWAHGWQAAPAAGLPSSVKGFRELGLKSWMTETSGEIDGWLDPKAAFPSESAFGVAMKLHQALTTGEQSAWLYWQLSDGKPAKEPTLTDARQRERAAKYVAAKHYFRAIRPGAQRVAVTGAQGDRLPVSAFHHASRGELTIVILNPHAGPASVTLKLPSEFADLSFEHAQSSETRRFDLSQLSPKHAQIALSLPAWGISTLLGRSK